MLRVKVRREDKLETHGVAAKSLDQCIEKGCKYLKVDRRREFSHISLKSDSTVVEDDDFFLSLDKDTLLIFNLKSGKSSGSPVDSITSFLTALRMDKDTLQKLEKGVERISDSQIRSIVTEMINQTRGNVDAEHRTEHPEWFARVTDKKVQTKSEVMESSAMNRVRGYYYEAKAVLRDASFTATQRKLANHILEKWWAKLKEELMFRHYFSRSHAREGITYCDAEGWFKCEGIYSCDSCEFKHSINPYSSAEQRAVFSQWNLDHQIEKARTVIPKVIELIKSNRAGKVNWDYFFKLMFTRHNLKLVHIACHIKQEHTEVKVDMKAAFTIKKA